MLFNQTVADLIYNKSIIEGRYKKILNNYLFLLLVFLFQIPGRSSLKIAILRGMTYLHSISKEVEIKEYQRLTNGENFVV
jgi:hypothetical protein